MVNIISYGAKITIRPLFNDAREYLRIVGHLRAKGGAQPETPARLSAIATDPHCPRVYGQYRVCNCIDDIHHHVSTIVIYMSRNHSPRTECH